MIVAGLVATLFVLSLENQRLTKQNQKLVGDLKTQKQISNDCKARTQSLVREFENLTFALNVSKVEYQNLSNTSEIMTHALIQRELEIGDLKEDIKNLIDQNQNLIDNFESKHQSLEHYQKLHQNCSKEQKLGRDLIEDLKLQNQNLTKDLEKMDSAKKALVDSIPDELKNQLLFKASENGDVNQARLAVEIGAKVNATNIILETPLHYAVKNGHFEIAEFLLQNGADVEGTSVVFGPLTPLHIAAKEGRVEIAELLIKNGANVNAQTNGKNTPLHLAARHGYPKMVEVLLNHGARKDLMERYYLRTPLEIAEQYKEGDYQKVIALLENN